MKNFKVLMVLSVLVCFMSCKQGERAKVEAGQTQYFGEKIEDVGVISFDELIDKMGTEEEVEGLVSGKVEAVCQAKGCWMNIVSPDGKVDDEMFVKFKDYGFFMPLDIAGKEVIMKGKAYKEETTVEELRHYAEDEGKSEEEIAAITEPIVELKFMADGVILKP